MIKARISAVPQHVLDATQQLHNYPDIVDGVLSRWGTLALQVFLDGVLISDPSSPTRTFSQKDFAVLLQLYTLNAKLLEALRDVNSY